MAAERMLQLLGLLGVGVGFGVSVVVGIGVGLTEGVEVGAGTGVGEGVAADADCKPPRQRATRAKTAVNFCVAPLI